MSNKLADKFLGFLLVALIAGALVGGLLSAVRDGATTYSTEGLLPKGTVAPPILAVRLGDHKPVGSDQLEGKVVVLDFWGTWCPHCVDEAPTIRDIAQAYAGQGVVVLALNSAFDGGPESEATVSRFLERHHLQGYPVAFPAGPVIADYKVQAFPALYVLGKDGTVRFGAVGEVPGSTLRAQIDAALKG